MKKHSDHIPVHTRKGQKTGSHHQPAKPATGGTAPVVKGSAVQGAAPKTMAVPKPSTAATTKKSFPLKITSDKK